MKITIKLGGPLRERIKGHDRGLMTIDLAPGSMVSDALTHLDLGGDRVRVLMLNGRAIQKDVELKEGDRLGLFPREQAFNMCTAISFFNPLARETIAKKIKE